MKPFKSLAVSIFVMSLHSVSQAGEFDLQGHRGARGLLPENTLPAFEKALAIGVTTLELDVGVSRDGKLVVSHDPRLSPNLTRDTSGEWLEGKGPSLSSLTYQEISAYDVGRVRPGSRYASRFPNQTAHDGARIPSLEQVFALVGNLKTRLNIETKIRPDLPDETPDPATFSTRLVETLKMAGLSSRATIQSFDWRTLKQVQRIAPQIPTVYLTAQQRWLDNIQAGNPGPSPWTAGMDVDEFKSLPTMLKTAGAAVWSPYWRDLTPESLAESHSLGLKVVVWTVNASKDMAQLIDMGVDGIISDYPDRLLKVLKEKGFTKNPDGPFYFRAQ